MALNLLAWREKKIKKQMMHDLFMSLLLVSMVSLLFELGFDLMHQYENYLFYQKKQFEQKILLQKEHFDQAQKMQEQYLQLKKQQQLYEANQLKWRQVWQDLQIIAAEKDSSVQFSDIVYKNHIWLVDGYAEKLDQVNLYQKKLEEKQYLVELMRWKPSMSDSSFQLSIEKNNHE